MMIERFEIDAGAEVRDGQLFVSGRGANSGKASRVLVPQGHGFASMPGKGGIGVVAYLNGDPESPVLIGHDNPGGVPALGAGGTAIYDSTGAIVSIVSGTIRLVGPTIDIQGPVTITGTLHVTGDITSDSPDGDDE